MSEERTKPEELSKAAYEQGRKDELASLLKWIEENCLPCDDDGTVNTKIEIKRRIEEIAV